MRRFALAALLCALLASGCRVVYLDPNGLDSNPGTKAQPKRSFQAACMAPADSQGRFVIVGEGTYPEQGIPPACARTLFVEDGPAVLRATGDAFGPNYPATLQIDASDIEVRGIEVDSNGFKRKGVHVSSARVKLAGMKIGNTSDNKAIEATGDDFWVQDSLIHDARIVSSDAHLEGIFLHEADRFHLLRNVFRNNAVYDVALTRCTWCSPVPAPMRDGVIEGNQFFHSHQCCDIASWHYTELAFYQAMGEARGFTVRNNFFETRADGRGGVLLEPPWIDGIRCGNTEGPVQGILGAEWKAPC